MYLNEARARDLMERNNLDAVVVSSPLNLLYTTGFHSGWVEIDAWGIVPRSPDIPKTMVIGHGGLMTLAADRTAIDVIRTWENAYIGRICPIPGQPHDALQPTTPAIDEEIGRLLGKAQHLNTNNEYEALALTLRELGLDKARLGFDELEAGEITKERHLADIEIRGARDLMFRVRMVKTPDEIGQLREAARLNDEATRETIDSIEEGMDVADVAIAYRSAVAKRGGAPAQHGGYIAGIGEMGLAGRYGYRLKRGDVMLAGTVASYGSYYNDPIRTVVVGGPTSSQAQAHSHLERAFEELTPLMRPGINSAEVGKSLWDTVKREGGDVDHLEMNLHTMGLDIVEIQHQFRQEGFLLEPGVCFCILLFYRAPECGEIFSLEHNYLVTEDGWEQLEKTPQHLLEVG